MEIRGFEAFGGRCDLDGKVSRGKNSARGEVWPRLLFFWHFGVLLQNWLKIAKTREQTENAQNAAKITKFCAG